MHYHRYVFHGNRRVMNRVYFVIGAFFVISVMGTIWKRFELHYNQGISDYDSDSMNFRRKGPAIVVSNTLQSKRLAELINDSMQNRLALIKEKCNSGWHPKNRTLFDKMNAFYFDSRHKLGYCHVAKAGCTFWLRIFSYLTRRSVLKFLGINSPFEIPRIQLHSGSLSPRTNSYWPEFKDTVYRRSYRFLFARNPYSRILSVYLDKYYLLGYTQIKFDPSITCDTADKNSFNQFLNVAFNSSDHHLFPISELCNPCEYHPHAIGKMETFKSDAQFILDRGNYGSLLRHYNHTYRIEIELESIILENFAFLANIQSRFGEQCLSAQSLSQRLWNVFQYNGYIPSNVTFPKETFLYTKSKFFEIFRSVVRKHPMTLKESLQQKRRYEAEFYASVSADKIKQIQQIYKGDFELFGYDENVPDAMNGSGA